MKGHKYSRLAVKCVRVIILIHLVLYCLFTLRLKNLKLILANRKKSSAQFHQDLFVISQIDLIDEHFYFVEFGATNGVDLGNTLLFEREFLAKGIVAEPAKIYHKDLFRNRACNISTRSVWSLSDLLIEFFEDSNPDLSGLNTDRDFHSHKNLSRTYDVKTISLLDLLKNYSAPKEIDLLSIDTEGTEFEILNAFSFSEYSFKVIICEHNFSKNRKRIKNLLENHGYMRKFSWISFVDDYYFAPPKS